MKFKIGETIYRPLGNNLISFLVLGIPGQDEKPWLVHCYRLENKYTTRFGKLENKGITELYYMNITQAVKKYPGEFL